MDRARKLTCCMHCCLPSLLPPPLPLPCASLCRPFRCSPLFACSQRDCSLQVTRQRQGSGAVPQAAARSSIDQRRMWGRSVGGVGCERGRCDAVGQGLKWDNRAKNWGLEGYRRPGEGQRAQARKTVQAGPGEENGWRAGVQQRSRRAVRGGGKTARVRSNNGTMGAVGGSRGKVPGEGAVGVAQVATQGELG